MFSTDSKTISVNGVSPIAIASQAVVYTNSFEIGMASAFSLSSKLSGSNPNVQVVLQLSDTAPANSEGIADAANWVQQDGGAPIYTALADTNLHKITLAPTVSRYARLQLTGNSGNGAGVTGVFKLISQQQLGR